MRLIDADAFIDSLGAEDYDIYCKDSVHIFAEEHEIKPAEQLPKEMEIYVELDAMELKGTLEVDDCKKYLLSCDHLYQVYERTFSGDRYLDRIHIRGTAKIEGER